MLNMEKGFFLNLFLSLCSIFILTQCKNPMGDDSHIPVGGSGAAEDTDAPSDITGMVLSGYAIPTRASTLSWSASTDNIAVDHYEIAFGTTGGGSGANDIVDWFSVGNAISYQLTDAVDGVSLLMSSGTNYYFSVKAVDAAGNESDPQVQLFRFFRPEDYANLILWLDAQDTNSFFQDAGCSTPVTSDGESVGCWQDKSGNGHNFIVNAGTPTYRTGRINGYSSIEIANSERLETPDSGLINTSNMSTRSHYIVFNSGADVTTRKALFKEGGGTNGAAFYVEGGSIFVGVWIGSGGTRAWLSTAVTVNTNYIAGFVFDAASNTFVVSVNGVAASQAALGVAKDFLSHSGDIDIGSGDSGIRIQDGSSSTISSTIPDQGEHVMYTGSLDATEQQVVEGYLACKWGIQSLLPLAHNYKSTCP